MRDRTERAVVAALSAAVLGFLFWLVYGRADQATSASGASVLPLWNAACNVLCAGSLLGGYRAIRAGKRQQHIALMLTAVTFSALFLAGYVTHHYTAGDTSFQGQGSVRAVYFAILISHVLVTVVTLPMILMTLAHAASGRFEQHKRLARWTLPAWLYVSVTGVLVFVFLRWWS